MIDKYKIFEKYGFLKNGKWTSKAKNKSKEFEFISDVINKIINTKFDKKLVCEMLSEIIDSANLHISKEQVKVSKEQVKVSKELFACNMIRILSQDDNCAEELKDEIEEEAEGGVDEFEELNNNFNFELFDKHFYSIFQTLRNSKFFIKSEVEFDYENCDISREEQSQTKARCPMDISGFWETSDNNTVLIVAAGGDWEQPVCTIIYWTGTKFAAYAPKAGNCWNHETEQAFGNIDCEVDNGYIKGRDKERKFYDSPDFIYDVELMLAEFQQTQE